MVAEAAGANRGKLNAATRRRRIMAAGAWHFTGGVPGKLHRRRFEEVCTVKMQARTIP